MAARFMLSGHHHVIQKMFQRTLRYKIEDSVGA
jgi:hypothetical protein